MGLAIVHSRAQLGIEAPTVTVEVHLSNGMPGLTIVGLPETAVRESKDRVRSAIINSHFEFPSRRITINLAPADLPKEGGRFDLPIALGILAASGQIPLSSLNDYEFAGELALDGALRNIKGTLPLALGCKKSSRRLVIPKDNCEEAALVKDLIIYPARSLLEVCAHLSQTQAMAPAVQAVPTSYHGKWTDLSEVKGQYIGKRALEVAAAGGHNLLFVGPPGTGKSLLASCMPSILPPLGETEALEAASIASLCGDSDLAKHFFIRPFRHPHHTSSAVALVGGGSHPKPGEISLAHKGVLFLDELPEFDRKVLEVLREPLETGSITVSRAARQAEFPAEFQLIAAMNPCPCGYSGSQIKECRCSTTQLNRYQNKLSGPLLDRIDLQVEIPHIPIHELNQSACGETSLSVQQRVSEAQAIQLARQGCLNSRLAHHTLTQHCWLAENEQNLLNRAVEKLKLSARSYHRVIKVARTLADLENCRLIQTKHLTEALSYRKKEQKESALSL